VLEKAVRILLLDESESYCGVGDGEFDFGELGCKGRSLKSYGVYKLLFTIGGEIDGERDSITACFLDDVGELFKINALS
jgi:hypothetical protein